MPFRSGFDFDWGGALWARLSLAHTDKLPFTPCVYQTEKEQEQHKYDKKHDKYSSNYQQRFEEHGRNYSFLKS
jgi:hypothetical protein